VIGVQQPPSSPEFLDPLDKISWRRPGLESSCGVLSQQLIFCFLLLTVAYLAYCRPTRLNSSAEFTNERALFHTNMGPGSWPLILFSLPLSFRSLPMPFYGCSDGKCHGEGKMPRRTKNHFESIWRPQNFRRLCSAEQFEDSLSPALGLRVLTFGDFFRDCGIILYIVNISQLYP